MLLSKLDFLDWLEVELAELADGYVSDLGYQEGPGRHGKPKHSPWGLSDAPQAYPIASKA